MRAVRIGYQVEKNTKRGRARFLSPHNLLQVLEKERKKKRRVAAGVHWHLNIGFRMCKCAAVRPWSGPYLISGHFIITKTK